MLSYFYMGEENEVL